MRAHHRLRDALDGLSDLHGLPYLCELSERRQRRAARLRRAALSQRPQAPGRARSREAARARPCSQHHNQNPKNRPMSISDNDLEILRQWDTPTICNGLELVCPERRALEPTPE